MTDPRHDQAAERMILGAALLDGRILDDLTLRPTDFHIPAHEELYSILQSERRAGNPTDPIAISNVLHGTGTRVQPVLLHELMGGVTTPASAPHYAKIVAGLSMQRRIQRLGSHLQQLGTDGAWDQAHEALDQAREALDEVERTATNGDLRTFQDALEDAINAWQNPEDTRAYPTGWTSLDDQLNGGWKESQVTVLGARPAVGKALSLDTPIPTPAGWTTMGELRPGDTVYGADGKPTRVTFTTEVMHDRKCYRLTFNDGSTIIADAEHQWFTSTRASRRAEAQLRYGTFNRESKYSRDQRDQNAVRSVVTTQDIFDTQRTGTDNRANHAIRVCSPVEAPEAQLPLDPYILGVWLGDGDSNGPILTTADQEIVDNVLEAGYSCRKLVNKYRYSMSDGRGGTSRVLHALRDLGVLCNKHIPDVYLRASVDQRRRLLAGLLDTDGTVSSVSGRVAFAVTSEPLARGFEELALSLGYITTTTTKRVAGRSEKSSTCYIVGFTTSDRVFRLERKNALIQDGKNRDERFIVSVEEVESVPVRCIQVDNEDHLYLCGKNFIVTHNTLVATCAAVAAHHYGVGFFSLEMSETELVARMVAAEKAIDLGRLNSNGLNDDDWRKIIALRGEAPNWNMHLESKPRVTMSQIRTTLRSWQKRSPVKLVIIDYLQLVAPADRKDMRERQVARIAEDAKAIAKDFQCHVLLLAQVNRENTKREDKRPLVSDLRESGAIEANADNVILLHRDDEREGEIQFIVAKNRHGETGILDLAWRPHYASVNSMDPHPADYRFGR